MENLLSLAQKIANDIPKNEKDKMQNMDMNQMIQHVTKNVMNVMNDPDATNPLLSLAQNDNSRVENVDSEDSEDSEEDEDNISPKTGDLHFSINIKMEDIYKGKKKKISVTRKRVKKSKDDNGKSKESVYKEKKTITIPILPGTRDQQTISFEGEADELPGHNPGDIIVTINELPHEIFERNGDNLYLIKDISLSELFSFEYNIEHLDGHILKIKSNEKDILHLNDGIRKIEGEGMPISENNQDEENPDKKFGDLFIRFNLVLPETFDKKHIKTIKEMFPSLEDDHIKYKKISEKDKVVEKELEFVTEEDMQNLEEYDSDEDESDSDDYSDSDDDEDEDEDDDDEDEDEDDSDDDGEEDESVD